MDDGGFLIEKRRVVFFFLAGGWVKGEWVSKVTGWRGVEGWSGLGWLVWWCMIE